MCSHQSALAVLPYCPPAQQLRSTFDPAYGRWPAHVNLLFPAPLELPQEALAQALREIPAGKLCLNRLGVFEHSHHATVYCGADFAAHCLLLRSSRAAILWCARLAQFFASPENLRVQREHEVRDRRG